MDAPIVIVGAGQAGFETAASLRNKGYTGGITVCGKEPGLPYQRPPLSKAFLSKDPNPDSVTLRPMAFFADHRIDLRSSLPVTAIDRLARKVTLGEAEQVDYSHLVLATGTRNRKLPVPGAELRGVHYLRTLSEASLLATTLKSCSAVVVVGAGFIGLEVAAAARASGAAVTVVEAVNRPMARAVSEDISRFFVSLHEGHGVTMRMGTGVSEILEKDGRAAGVVTSAGDVIDADIVVVGVGVVPNTELAENAGLATENGIIVDSHLRTVDPDISAVGDCSSFPNPTGTGHIRLESIQNAVDQARCVAKGLASGTPLPYQSIPWFWTEQFSVRLQMAGLITGYDNVVLRGSPNDGAFSICCFSGDRLLGIESVNRVRDHMAARRLLTKGCNISRDQAADVKFDLAALAL